jgi:hypothetical protein
MQPTQKAARLISSVRTHKMIKATLLLLLTLSIIGGVLSFDITTLNAAEIQTLTLQYRIWQDAVAPSQFVAVFEKGMTLGLKIHWKISEEKKKELDVLISQLEKNGKNGQEFIVEGKWISKGFELEIYNIEKKF